MIFDKELSIQEALPNMEVNEEELIKFAEAEGLKTDNTYINIWYVFGVKYMMDKGWDIITAKSFAETITYIATDVRLNTVPEYYKGQMILDEVLWGIIHEGYDYLPEAADFENIMKEIEDLYNDFYENYTYKTEQLLLKVSVPLRHKFNNVPGNTYSKKLNYLISLYERSNE